VTDADLIREMLKNAEYFDSEEGADKYVEANAALDRLLSERAAMLGAIGEPCAECGHVDWRADPNEYLERMEASEAAKSEHEAAAIEFCAAADKAEAELEAAKERERRAVSGEAEPIYTFFHEDGPIRLTETELSNEYMRLREECEALLAEAPAGIKHFRQRALDAEAAVQRYAEALTKIASDIHPARPVYEERPRWLDENSVWWDHLSPQEIARAAIAAGGEE
jgi:hypothetical protein